VLPTPPRAVCDRPEDSLGKSDSAPESLSRTSSSLTPAKLRSHHHEPRTTACRAPKTALRRVNTGKRRHHRPITFLRHAARRFCVRGRGERIRAAAAARLDRHLRDCRTGRGKQRLGVRRHRDGTSARCVPLWGSPRVNPFQRRRECPPPTRTNLATNERRTLIVKLADYSSRGDSGKRSTRERPVPQRGRLFKIAGRDDNLDGEVPVGCFSPVSGHPHFPLVSARCLSTVPRTDASRSLNQLGGHLHTSKHRRDRNAAALIRAAGEHNHHGTR